MKKKILYIGGFEMPNKNAAAQRVLSIAKALREFGYDTMFYGITKTEDYRGVVDGFNYEARTYPQSIKDWFRYALGLPVVDYIKSKSPDIVITYNYPAIAQEKVLRYCHRNKIKVIGDITEWYKPNSFVKMLDTNLRMRWSNKHLDGIIAISRYLNGYYGKYHTIQLPPIIDTNESKWKVNFVSESPEKIHLIYAGQPGYSKDRLDFIINGLANTTYSRIVFNVVGISKAQYIETFGYHQDLDKLPIKFHGRLPHDESVRMLLGSDFQIFFRPNIRVNNAGFPTKFVESMTAGVPVIMNRISNVDDYLKDGYNGILIDNPKEEEICRAIERISNLSREDVDEMKRNCNKIQFDYHEYVNDLKTFIEWL